MATFLKYWYIWLAILAAVLFFGGRYLYRAGTKNGLQQQLAEVNRQLQNTSARQLPDDHLKLLAKKIALEKLLLNFNS